MPPYLQRTIEDVAPRLAAREISCLELTEACLEQIDRHNGRVNAFITVLGEQARAAARRADEEIATHGPRGPLHGIPVSLKDLIDVADVPTTGGSRLLQGHVPRTDATVTARLKTAGAILLGKCNLHEVAFGTTSEDSAYGPVRNPWDATRSAGGSSGGSAAAVVEGMGYASIGTDTGGSIRIPSAACGCVGLKPTYGELPCDGIIPLSTSLDHVGPLTRSVADAWTVFHALRGDRHQLPLTRRNCPPLARLRLAVLGGYFSEALEPGVRDAFDRAVATLRAAGVRTTDCTIPHAGDIASVYLHLQLPEASAYHAAALDREPEAFTRPVRLRLEMGRYVLAEDYARARNGAQVLRAEVDAALEGCDALVLPTLPIEAPTLGAVSAELEGGTYPVRGLMLRLTQLFDVTGHPALSIPCGHTPNDLPVGLQLVGRLGRTDELLEIGHSAEEALGART